MQPNLNNTKNDPFKKQIAIFASGAGSNAQKIIEYFQNNTNITVALIVCNKQRAGVVQIAAENHIPVLLIEKDRFFSSDIYVAALKEAHIDFIVLAGFLWKIPGELIKHYRNKIINIHPALLPKFGGKGMYGANVHEAVIAAGEKESGITIHYVDEHYDNGDIILQATCTVTPTDTADTLAEKIHRLEHENFARVIEACVKKLV